MRIAIDTQSTLGSKTGIGRYTSELAKALRSATDHEILEINAGRPTAMRIDRRLRWQQAALPGRAKRAGAQILHVTGFDAPLWKPCPVVLTVHDLIGMIFPGKFPPVSRVYWSKWLPYTIRFADRVIAVSEHTRRDLLRLTGTAPEKVTVIPEAAGAEYTLLPREEAEVFRTRHGLPERFILFVSTLEPRKGIDSLLAAFGTLGPRFPDVVLVMAGKPGWGTERLLDAASLPASRIRLLGHVPDGDMPGLYSCAEVLAFPSRYEGFGLPVIEAMACGTPVVSSSAASLPEVAGDAAMLIDAERPGELAEALAKVLSDGTLREEMRVRGLRRASLFSWEKTALATVRVYEEALQMVRPEGGEG